MEIFYGEPFFLDRSLASMAAKATLFTGKDDKEDFLSFITDHHENPHVVIWSHVEEVSGKWWKALPEDTSPLTVRLFFYDKTIPAEISVKNTVQEYKPLKPFGKDYANFVLTEVSQYSLTLEGGEDTATAVVSYVGSDLYRLSTEIKKLSFLYEKGSVIPRATLKEILSPTGSVTTNMIADAFLEGNLKKILYYTGIFYDQEGSAGFLNALYAVLRTAEKIIHTLHMMSVPLKEEEIIANLKMNPWRYRNHYVGHVKKFSLERLLTFYSDAVKVDMSLKTGGAFYEAFEVSVISLFRV